MAIRLLSVMLVIIPARTGRNNRTSGEGEKKPEISPYDCAQGRKDCCEAYVFCIHYSTSNTGVYLAERVEASSLTCRAQLLQLKFIKLSGYYSDVVKFYSWLLSSSLGNVVLRHVTHAKVVLTFGLRYWLLANLDGNRVSS